MREAKFKETEIGMIPEDWELMTIDKIKANDKKAIISGPFGSNIGSRYFVEYGIPVIRGNNLKADMTRFIDDGFVFLIPEKATELNTWAERNDLIFTAAGTLGQVGIIPKNSKYEKYIISNKQLRLRVNESIIRPLFAFYWFSSPIMVSYIQQRNTGSTIPLINLSVLRSLPIPVPPIDIQDRIINIVDSLDSKIALNRSMNYTLESIGQALFKHWFVDFEFPNGEGKPYRSSGGEMVETELGEVPRGWEVVSLGKIAEFTRGFSYAGSEKSKVSGKHVFITLNSIYEGGGFKREFSYLTSERVKERHLVKEGDIIIANTEQTKTGTLLGFPALVEFPPNYEKVVGVFSHHITKVTPFHEEVKHFLYHYLYFYQSNAIKYHTGSVIWALDVNGWTKNEKVMLPKKEILITFSELTDTIFQRKLMNNRESNTLENIRDALLPKLMSGEIRFNISESEVTK